LNENLAIGALATVLAVALNLLLRVGGDKPGEASLISAEG
jgi:hypothetical protein